MKTYKTKPLEIFFKINGKEFRYATIYKNTNSHKFEAVKNYFKVDIFDFKDAIDNFGDLHFWNMRCEYTYMLDCVMEYIRWAFMYAFSEESKKNAYSSKYLLRVEITLRVDNTDKIISKWFTFCEGYFNGQPSEVLKIDSQYDELKSTVINEINNLMINDNENAALLVDSWMEYWKAVRGKE